MMVFCQSQASPAEGNRSISSTASPSASTSSPSASFASASTRSQCGVLMKASVGRIGGSPAAMAANGMRAPGRVSGSPASQPASVSIASATSSMERAITPTWSSVRDSCRMPLRGTRPWLGLKP